MAYSTDGVTWNAVADSKFGQQKINGIDYCNDRFVAFGYASMAYSTDGITWTQVSIPNGSLLDRTDMKGVAYGGGKYVVVANKGKMAESPDCVTWTEITETTFGYAEIYDITFGDGKFVAVGFSNDTYRGHIAYRMVE
jgi:sucrose-6-phosphate hydrolase SacC (GH32 family)